MREGALKCFSLAVLLDSQRYVPDDVHLDVKMELAQAAWDTGIYHRVLDVLLFVSGTEQGVERVAVGHMGARLALHLHIPEIGVDGIADCRLGRNLRLRFGSGNQAVADSAARWPCGGPGRWPRL